MPTTSRQKPSSKALYRQIEEAIQQDIRAGIYPENTQLPSEHALMEKYQVSRVTVRSALQALASRGVISTKRGKGSFVNPGELRIGIRLDEFSGFYSLIQQNGLAPNVKLLGWDDVPFPAEVCTKLSLEPNARGFVLYRLFTGDGKPAILVEEYMPFSSMKSEFVNSVTSELISKLPNSILEFADIVCTRRVTSSLVELSARTTLSAQSERYFTPDSQDALVCLDELLVGEGDAPIMFSRAFVNNDMIHFQFRRQRPADDIG